MLDFHVLGLRVSCQITCLNAKDLGTGSLSLDAIAAFATTKCFTDYVVVTMSIIYFFFVFWAFILFHVFLFKIYFQITKAPNTKIKRVDQV